MSSRIKILLIFTPVAWVALSGIAVADNCGTPSDCFFSQRAAIIALIAIATIAAFVIAGPGAAFAVFFIASDLATAATGRDPLTWEKTPRWIGLLGIIDPTPGNIAARGGRRALREGLEEAGDRVAARNLDEIAGEVASRGSDNIARIGRDTGGRTAKEWDEILSHVKDPTSFRAYELREEGYARDYYDAVRAAGDSQLDPIARSSGMRPDEIRQIRRHLFHEQHQLGDRFARFDPSADIADAWRRLESGNPHPSDLALLRHELSESNYMKEHPGAAYDEAHAAAKAAGFTWDPPPWQPGK